MSDETLGTFTLISKETDTTSGKSGTSSFIFGKCSAGFSVNTIPDENNEYISSRFGLNSGQDNISIEVEAENSGFTQGIYVNSELDTTNPGISFIDSTIDSENPTKRYFLKDFVLKSDIPSGIDLTNYEGDWSLTKTEASTNQYVQYKTGTIAETYHIYQLLSTGDNVVSSTSESGLFNGIGNSVLYEIEGKSYIDYLEGNTIENGYCASVAPGGIEYVKYENSSGSVACRVETTGDGVVFLDTTIQLRQFTLKSLVDRIVALETQVAELQSQLSAKANTASPTFTGKVSISNQ